MINQEENKKSFRFKMGVVLFITSTLSFMLLLVVPALELTTESKVKLSFALVIVGEVLFWVSGYLLGKEIFIKYKSYLNPAKWFKKIKKDSE